MSLAANGKKKIVVTGLGAVSPVGIGAHTMFDALCEGKSGIVRLPSWADEFPAKCGGLVQDFDIKQNGIKPKTASRNARYTHFALAAAQQAIADAKLPLDGIDSDRFGVIVGSGIGGIEWYESAVRNFAKKEEEEGSYRALRGISPFLIPALISNTASGMIAIECGAKGPNYCVTTACATGSHAIGAALKHLRDGEADIMLAGGTEAAITPVAFAGFCALTAMSTKYNDMPEKASRPFDKDRNGFVMGEGAGVLLLETEEHALKRGAYIYCELAGYASNCDANHITAPAPYGEGLEKCMRLALKDAAVKPNEVGYLNAHGTSTQLNDLTETQAIKKVFENHATEKHMKISSVKSMMGHSLGAAGGLEAVVCAKVFQTKTAPPTINLDEPDVEHGLDLDYLPNKKHVFDDIEAVLSDNLGFGGHNAAVVFRKYRPSS